MWHDLRNDIIMRNVKFSRHRTWFQASSGYLDSANWPGYEAEQSDEILAIKSWEIYTIDLTQQFSLSIFTDFRYQSMKITWLLRFLSIDYSGRTYHSTNNAFWLIESGDAHRLKPTNEICTKSRHRLLIDLLPLNVSERTFDDLLRCWTPLLPSCSLNLSSEE